MRALDDSEDIGDDEDDTAPLTLDSLWDDPEEGDPDDYEPGWDCSDLPPVKISMPRFIDPPATFRAVQLVLL
jgi:hypothetical protein